MASVAEKLRIPAAGVVRVINGPSDAADLLGPMPPGVELSGQAVEAAAVVLFVQDGAALARYLGDAVRAASGDRLLWLAYPKGGSGLATDLNRDKVAALVTGAGVTAVSQVAIDTTWSALRLRPSDRYRS
jgi:hypothetical protein